MNFKRFIVILCSVVTSAVIFFSWGCEQSYSTAPQLGKINSQSGVKTRPDCYVNLSNVRQTIRGFGGMNHPRWVGSLSDAEVDRAYGAGSGQIGFTILRIDIPPNSGNWNAEVSAAKRAKSHGAIVFAAPWSPPASMKTNNNTTGGELRTDAYGDYANHLRDFADYMSSNGASLYAISVQNEPDYVPNYESCGWSSSQMRTFLDNYASVIPVRIVAPETTQPKNDWYNALSSSSELDILATHLYGGSPTSYNSSKENWMTEHLENNTSWSGALATGKEIHDCMVNNYNAYIWWYIRRSYGPLDESGNVTKRGYVMSHFSRFVRPGYTRVDATSSPATGVSVSAYTDGNTLVIIAINQNSSPSNITFNLSGGQVSSFTKYETTSSSNVSNVGSVSAGSSMTNSLAAHSISTFVGTIGGGYTTTSTTTSGGYTSTTTSGSSWWGGGSWWGSTTTTAAYTTTTTSGGWTTTTSGTTTSGTTTTSGGSWWGGDSWWGSTTTTAYTTTTTSGGWTTTTSGTTTSGTTTTSGDTWWGGGSWW
jgi:glucuronoarabinoxylan endo-1,4-beta-xylanase